MLGGPKPPPGLPPGVRLRMVLSPAAQAALRPLGSSLLAPRPMGGGAPPPKVVPPRPKGGGAPPPMGGGAPPPQE
eukprot:7447829-Alexandrium_andersonii.AAC.1